MLSRVPGLPPPLEKAAPDSYADSSFVDAISITAMPQGFTSPNMPFFDGTIDPFDHMSQYKQKMMTVTAVGQVKEACMCKGFGPTLTRPALRWFVSLPNRLISTFAELGAGETIGEYNTRFNNEKVAVRECDVSKVVEAFRRGLHHDSDLYKQLTMHPCHSFELVQEKAAAAAIRLEEDILARVSLPNAPSVFNTSAVEKSGRKQSASKRDESYRPYGRGVNRIKENKQLPTLAEEIKRLYEQGELSHLLPCGGKQHDKVGSVKPATPPTYTKIINVITGGSDLRGLTYSAAKRLATETKGDRPANSCRISHSDLPSVAFNEEDICDEREHHDVLIITMSMANCTVRKVLVDTGSLVNLIMLKTIENMGFSEKDLQKKTIPLVGFSEETANSLGEIVIPTYVGRVNKHIRYLQLQKQPVQDKYIEPPSEKLDQINLDKLHPERTVLIGAGCTGDLRQQLIEFLQAKKDCFAWSHDDMVGIDPSIITYKFSVDPKCKPIQQR
ncbi:uncharacterized protein LOC141649585 [Silene latifolia]|uniref:uncharacterized protein LOC141649585 n=1 Tax=Silene latifolia TaxID=37657 RepID=UPI003D76A577